MIPDAALDVAAALIVAFGRDVPDAAGCVDVAGFAPGVDAVAGDACLADDGRAGAVFAVDDDGDALMPVADYAGADVADCVGAVGALARPDGAAAALACVDAVVTRPARRAQLPCLRRISPANSHWQSKLSLPTCSYLYPDRKAYFQYATSRHVLAVSLPDLPMPHTRNPRPAG